MRIIYCLVFFVALMAWSCADDDPPVDANNADNNAGELDSGADATSGADTSVDSGDDTSASDTSTEDTAREDISSPEDTSSPEDISSPEDTSSGDDVPTDPDAGSCPDPDDPEVHYVSDDPTECAAAFFVCPEHQTLFSNECGCGCIGPAEADGASCGGFVGDEFCTAEEFCRYERDENDVSTCHGNGIGHCTVKPLDCVAVDDPVCGCDGQTYTNDCAANAAGQDVYTAGPCTF